MLLLMAKPQQTHWLLETVLAYSSIMESSEKMIPQANDTEILQKEVTECKRFLAALKTTLTQDLGYHRDVSNPWLREVAQVECKDKRPKTIIGVVGATGSGKSSIINAILGEKQLVPTNCMRACTAVATEISYNDEPDAYRAVVEFVSQKEWQDELEHLLGDIVTGGKITGNLQDDGSETGIAFAKIQAVYPHINRHNLPGAKVEDLLDRDYIKDALGKEIEFSTNSAEELHKQTQKYVDSKEKLSEDFALHGLGASPMLDKIAYWPLVRKVRIYTKAPVLQSGAVLVDLPGVADSNTARAAIAEKYLQNCAALWIVAPIIRAVDDKSARYLLGESFKRQLFRDGTLRRITFVCSKTDEISIFEAGTTLRHLAEYRTKFETIDRDRTEAFNRSDALRRSSAEVKSRIDNVSKLLKELAQEERTYNGLQGKAKRGEVVHPLVRVEIAKRKLNEVTSDVPSSPVKKTKFESQMSRTFESPGKRITSITEPRPPQVQFREDTKKPRLSYTDVKAKITDLKAKKRDLKTEKESLKQREKEVKVEMIDNKAAIARIGVQEWLTCVRGRNEVSSRVIRKDFAAGLQDIHRDNNEDYEYGEAEEDVIQEGSEALPVFCVSVKGFYKVIGELRSEKTAVRFDSVEDTGIPALREHALKLGNDKLVSALRVFLDATKSLITSLRLWSSGGPPGGQLANIFSEGGDKVYMKLVEDFVSGMLATARGTMDKITQIIYSELFDILDGASRSASKAAVPTAMKWVASRAVNNPTPGLPFQTFKAVVRRSGVFANPQKTYNFNADLLEPYMRKIDGSWNNIFNTKVHLTFQDTIKEAAVELDKFAIPFGDRLERAAKGNGPSKTWEVFEKQMELVTASLGLAFRAARKSIESKQKEANRIPESSTERQLDRIYRALAQESGPRCYNRMKEMIKAHLEQNKDVIFNKVSGKIRKELRKSIDEVRASLMTDIETCCNSVRRDCENLCQQSRDFDSLPGIARDAILEVLNQVDVGLIQATELKEEVTVEPTADPEQRNPRTYPCTLRQDSTTSQPVTPLPAEITTANYWSSSESDSEPERSSNSDSISDEASDEDDE